MRQAPLGAPRPRAVDGGWPPRYIPLVGPSGGAVRQGRPLSCILRPNPHPGKRMTNEQMQELRELEEKVQELRGYL